MNRTRISMFSCVIQGDRLSKGTKTTPKCLGCSDLIVSIPFRIKGRTKGSVCNLGTMLPSCLTTVMPNSQNTIKKSEPIPVSSAYGGKADLPCIKNSAFNITVGNCIWLVELATGNSLLARYFLTSKLKAQTRLFSAQSISSEFTLDNVRPE